jgi:hypothetical protein
MGIGHEDIDQMVELGLLGPVNGARAQEPPLVVAPVAVQPAPVVAAPVAIAAPSLPSEAAAPLVAPTAPVAPVQAGAVRSRQQRYQDAYPIATRLTGGLGLRGFRLNLSVEGTSNYDELLALAPKIRSAVGPEKAADLDRALGL